MMELYVAYHDYKWMMDLVEELIFYSGGEIERFDDCETREE